jgi:hypothetical protein
MATGRGNLVAVGVMYFTATVSYATGSQLITSAVGEPGFLASLSSSQVRLGVLLEFINCASVVGIGMLLLPYLRKYYEGLALGYFATRVIEGALLFVATLGVLLLPSLSQRLTDAGAADAAQLQTLATLAADWHQVTFHVTMTMLGAGSLLLCYILYKVELVPRALAILGFVSYVSLLASGVLGIFAVEGVALLYAPGAIFEIAFPLVLIFRGLREPATSPRAQAAPAV